MLIVQILSRRSLSGSALTSGVCILDLMRYGHQIRANSLKATICYCSDTQ